MKHCQAVLLILDRQYPCDYYAPHKGLAHVSNDAGAMWCGDTEEESNNKGEVK